MLITYQKITLYCLVLLLYGLCTPFLAIADDPFIVEEIEIFHEAADLEEAKIQAGISGITNALRIVLTRMVASSNTWKIDGIMLYTPTQYLLRSEVLWQRMTSTSYRAKMRYHFDAEKLKPLLHSQGIKYRHAYNAPILLIQFDVMDDIIALNDMGEERAWIFPSSYGISKFASIKGDLQDEEDTNIIYFRTAKYQMFQQLLTRYKIDQVALVKLVKMNGIDILLVRLFNDKTDKILYKFYATPNENYPNEVVKLLDDYHKGYKNCAPVKKYTAPFTIKKKDAMLFKALDQCLYYTGDELHFAEKPEEIKALLKALQIN